MSAKCVGFAFTLFVWTVGGQVSASVVVSGYLTDTLSGRVGATAQHAEMSKRNVATGKAKYAIYDEKSKVLYILACSTPVMSGPLSAGVTSDTSAALSASEWKNLDQSCVEQYLGKRVRITGTVNASPITRAGQSYAPDAIAAPKDAAGNADQSSAARTVSGDANASAGQGPARVQHHASVASGAGRGAQDTSTPVAGILTIQSVEILSSLHRTQ